MKINYIKALFVTIFAIFAITTQAEEYSGSLNKDKIIINTSDNKKDEYGVNNILNIKFSNDDNFILSTTNSTEVYSISQIDSITTESQDLTSLILVSDKGENKIDLSSIEKIEFGYSIPHVIADSISISLETIKLAPSSTIEFGVNIAKKEYIDEDIYPLYALIEKVSTNSVSTPATVEVIKRSDSTGSEKAEYICKLIIGDYEKEIPVSVDYGVYLSHNLIITDNLNEVCLLTYKTISLGETFTYSFFCYLDGATDAQKAAIKEKLLNVNNYEITPMGGKYNTLSLEVGDITINDASDVWVVTVPMKSTGKTFEQGIVSLTIEDKILNLNLTCDDGKHFDELYISFESIYTYSEETKTGSRKLDQSYLKYIGGNNVSTEKERFKVIVWYSKSPDDRGDYIEWNLNMPFGDNAPVKYIGMQKLNTQQFEFEFEVNAAGVANVEFTIENPKADDPSLTEEQKEFYEKYRKQTVTAMVNVVDRNSVEVESVVFVDGPDPLVANVIETQETSAGSVPLYTYILPEESAGPWPSIFSVECKDGAVATVKQSGIDETTGEEITPEVSITHAGTIIVTATSKDKTATLEITAKLKIDQISQGDKLQLQTSKYEYAPGETDKIKTTLRSKYKVNDDEYTWVSSNPGVVSVDNEGNITALSDGTATITVSITDAYGYTATATKEVSVRSVNADADLNAPEWDDYYVIDLGEGGIYYIDTEEGASDLFVLSLDAELSGNGVYTAGWDFAGTIQFPTNDIFDIVGGTITISGGKWTFDLQVSDGTISGTVTGTKEYMFFEW